MYKDISKQAQVKAWEAADGRFTASHHHYVSGAQSEEAGAEKVVGLPKNYGVNFWTDYSQAV